MHNNDERIAQRVAHGIAVRIAEEGADCAGRVVSHISQGLSQVSVESTTWYTSLWIEVAVRIRRINGDIADVFLDRFVLELEGNVMGAFHGVNIHGLPIDAMVFGRLVSLLANFYETGALGDQACGRMVRAMEYAFATAYAGEFRTHFIQFLGKGKERVIRDGRNGMRGAFVALDEMRQGTWTHRVDGDIPNKWTKGYIVSFITSIKASVEGP